ncbi:unnamed protein product, partial [Tetraodon nigroviridis]
LDPYMDDDFVKQAFSAMGESPTGVKIITHRITGWVLSPGPRPLLPPALRCRPTLFWLSPAVVRQDTALWSWLTKPVWSAVSKDSTENWSPDQTRLVPT